ncbi:inverse autotransporter beta domain-containing protein [Xenorhabdus szentirmaii]|uniref:inverse autotransporter beta domain-containing protein n=1 Tax=Xenorhabdus szentirmaii TaxID=290112 RepID=UPI0019B86B6D|nr:inverse autotransporter beta domain-containing protein [Xenorhabdus sp. CUL]MBD2793891.1 inverse autotransporter beta domain-containing protein [Xenorhabdus sp. CUL]
MLEKQDKQWAEKSSHHLKRVAWVNIFAQVAFPVAAAFTPAVAMAPNEHQVQKASAHTKQTRPYRLSAGESVKTVAKRHGLTVTELKKLNQQRTFNKPFTALSAGDEIEVPHSVSDKLLADNQKHASAAEIPANAIHQEAIDQNNMNQKAIGQQNTEPSTTEHWLANAASRAAGMLKSGNIVDNTKSQLQGMAVGEANQAVRNWLQRYGNVRIQANIDDRGRLDGSQFDMLLPLYDTKKHLTFTQIGVRHIDSRTTANFGLGQRHFFDSGMFGYNAFLDHDITRDHTRFGIGAEYARDFIKFGANGYFRASGWKDGKKLAEYEERPANGFDLRAEGYLPTYPQLGGKFIYEQYFGDEVGLLSEKQRQKNPAAFTLGMNYTPIPLVKLGLDRRQSASGGGETLLNFGLNYEIGTPWSKQIDPDAVAFKRTLQGGRYDLVERNNQIVLEYRKKNLIRLMMENRISGRGGAIIPLNVSVSTKNGLKEIVWDTANLVAGGGKLEAANVQSTRSEGGELFKSAAASSVSGGTHYLLTLPPYNEKGNNTYSLSGVAYDKQGNASERMEAQIVVIASAVDSAGSGFEPANKSMVADGKTQTVIRLKLTDKNGKPISGAASNITLTDDKSKLTGDGKDPVLGTEIKEVPEGSGIYEVTATAGTKHGKWTINPKVDGNELTPTVIDFGDSLANMVDTDKTKFEPDNGNLKNEGDETDIVLHLTDKDGKPITGAVDKIKLTEDKSDLYGQAPEPTVTSIKEDPAGSGIYKAKVIAGKKKGTLKITPNVDGKELKPTQVTFGESLSEIVDPKGSVFTPETNVLTADNEDSTIMTLHLVDKKGRPIPNAKDSITFEDNGDQLTGNGKNKPVIDKVWEEPAGSGTYKVKVKSGDKTGKWEITTKIDGKPLENKTAINFATNKADLVDPGKSTFTTKNGGPLNPGETMEIEVDLNDKDGSPISGVEKEIKLLPDDHELYGTGSMPHYGEFKETSPGSGKYVATVTAGEKKGKWKLTPEAFGKQIGKPETITFGQSLAEILNPESPGVEPVDGKALPADGVTKKILKITLNDQKGQPISGAKDSIKVIPDNSNLTGEGKDPSIGEVKEIGNGVYEVEITAGKKTGKWVLNTTIDGTKNQQPIELEFDENKAPSVSIDYLEGELTIGKTLKANYKFESNGSNATDRSFYVWGEKGTTAARVVELAKSAGAKEPIELAQKNGEGRVNNGEPITYVIQESDNNKVLEVSILAANGADLRANGPETALAVYDPNNPGRIIGGNGSGGVSDPTATAKVDDLELTGELTLPMILKAHYKFEPNGGDARDQSLYAWEIKGEEKEVNTKDWKKITQTSQNGQKGQVDISLAESDAEKVAGKLIVVSILPVNGLQQKSWDAIGTLTTDPNDPTNNTSGGGRDEKGQENGTIVNPSAMPIISKLTLNGFLVMDNELTATYHFDANKGFPDDESEYEWYRLSSMPDEPAKPNENSAELIAGASGTVDKSGHIPLYIPKQEDFEKFIELRVYPKKRGEARSNTPIKVNTSKQYGDIGDSKNLSGAGDGFGRVMDPKNAPIIKDMNMSVEEKDGQKHLIATYTFDNNQGDSIDNSRYLWGAFAVGEERTTTRDVAAKNQFVEANQDINKQPHKVPSYPLKQEDYGKIIELTVQGKNKNKKDGQPETINSLQLVDSGLVNADGTMKGIAGSFKITPDKAEVDADGTDAVMAKKGETIKLTIHTKGQDGRDIGGVPVTINLKAENRKQVPEIVTVKLEKETGALESNGSGDVYTGHTDEKGDLIIEVTDPDGIGTRTELVVTVNDDGNKLNEQKQDVIFTVITSPNTSLAKYWGHMTETVTAGKITFERPKLFEELKASGEAKDLVNTPVGNDIWYFRFQKEDYAIGNWDNISRHCTNGIATIEETRNLMEQETNMTDKYGWPGVYYTTSSYELDSAQAKRFYRKNLETGNEIFYYGTSANHFVSCKK